VSEELCFMELVSQSVSHSVGQSVINDTASATKLIQHHMR